MNKGGYALFRRGARGQAELSEGSDGGGVGLEAGGCGPLVMLGYF